MGAQQLNQKNFMAPFRRWDLSHLQGETVDPIYKGPYIYVNEGHLGYLWYTVIIFIVGHGLLAWAGLLILYEMFLGDFYQLYYTYCWLIFLGIWSGVSVTAGAHRLWTHKSYEATLPLRIFLMIGFAVAGQQSLYIWCTNHRVHHKFSDTDKDPYNVKRGFVFAHITWLMHENHPDFERTRVKLDYSDMLNDPVFKFQTDNEYLLHALLTFALPVAVPVLFWQESLWHSFLIIYILRMIGSLHLTSLVNSAAHMFGDRPYDKNIQPVNNSWISLLGYGEGFHNYHHVFPNDYRLDETGSWMNFGRTFVDLMAYLGQAYNLKQATPEMVQRRIARNRAGGKQTEEKPKVGNFAKQIGA